MSPKHQAVVRAVAYRASTGEVWQKIVCPVGQEMPDPGPGSMLLAVQDDVELPGYVADGAYHVIPPRPAEFMEFDWTEKAWRDLRTIADIKDLKVAQLKQARDATEYGTFTYAGFVLDGDAAAQRRLAGLVSAAKAAIAAGQTFTTTFILADNTTTEFTAEDFIGIEMAKIWQVDAAFTRYRDLRARVEAATTVEELDAISWD